MKFPLVASPVQARQTRQQFTNPKDDLSYELGKAVQELPPLYARLLAGGISIVVVGTIGWANFSKVDEVATANGELIPVAEVRPMRSLEGGTIRAVKVKEGQLVKQGDVLVELDSALPQTEVDRLESSAKLIREDLARLEAERTGRTIAGTSLQNQLLMARLQEFDSQQAQAVAEAKRQLATVNEDRVRLTRMQENLADDRINLANAEIILAKTNSTLANAVKRERGLRILVAPENRAFPQLEYLDAQDKLTQAQAEGTRAQDAITNARDKVSSQEQDIAAQAQVIQEAEQAYQAAQHAAARLGSERQQEILTELNKRREELATVAGQLAQAKKQQAKETITAPFNGMVYNVKATSGSVQTGEELLSILPQDEELSLEVKVLNRDIGFIHQGMKAKVKLATFPFQEFGTIDGTVVQVSPNATVEKDLGLVFPTRIKLDKHSIQVRGQDVKLTPGMAATGEIVTRKKSILSFLLEPVTRRFSEAFSVR